MDRVLTIGLMVLVISFPVVSQTAPAQGTVAPSTNQATNSAPLTLTLQDALTRARKNNPEYRAALTEFGLAKEDRVQSRAALLPNVNYNTSFLYTQGNGTPTGKFIGANGVHEYISQGNVHQEISLQNVADYRRTSAAMAVAQARSEIAARGLVVTVVQAYYGFVVAQRKYATSQRAAAEAQNFFDISQKLERGGEVAHSDVIAARAVMDNDANGRLVALTGAVGDASERHGVGAAGLNVPELNAAAVGRGCDAVRTGRHVGDEGAATAALQAASQEVAIAWNGFLPSLSLDYFYGIDANRFATRGVDLATGLPVRNLGYSAAATLQLPIWDWGSNRSKLKQADLRRDQARVELSFAQRQLLGNLRTFYSEAQTARQQLESLSRSAELAADSLRLITLRYQSGEATVLEVVDAQNTLNLGRNAFNDGQARYRMAIANLQTLTGSF